MKAYSGKEVCFLLKQNGWQFKRIKGSHHIYAKPGERVIITVPVHGNRTLKPGLQRTIFKLARLAE